MANNLLRNFTEDITIILEKCQKIKKLLKQDKYTMDPEQQPENNFRKK